MTVLVWWGKCLWMRPGRGSFRGVACSPEAKPAPSGTAGNPWTNTVETLAQRGRSAYTGVGIGESKKGNPGLDHP